MHTNRFHVSKGQRITVIFVSTLLLILFTQAALSNPNDAPVGWKHVWKGSQWEYQWVSYGIERVVGNGDTRTYLEREYSRINDTDANLIMWAGFPNYGKLFDDYDPSTSLKNHQAIFYNMVVPGNDDERSKKPLNWFFNQYARYGTMQLATAQVNIDTVITYMQNDYMSDPAFMGYPLFGEIWGREFDDDDKAFTLGEYAISKIRTRDPIHPIVINHDFSATHQNKINNVVDTSDVEDIFNADEMTGWNIFSNFDYPFRGIKYSEDDVTVVPDNRYDGGVYYRDMWHRNVAWNRWLSYKMEDYDRQLGTETIQGPPVEWWHAIQAHRLWRVRPTDLLDPDPEDFEFYYATRRPTKYEFRMQAYSALAAGARGILAWPYLSLDYEDCIPAEVEDEFHDLDGLNTLEELENEDELDDLYVVKETFEGVISAKFCWDADANADPDSIEIRDFRKPIRDAVDGIQDNEYSKDKYNYRASYPFDEIAAVFDNMHDLLPIMRDLRWWWTISGKDDTTSYDVWDNQADGRVFMANDTETDMSNSDMSGLARFGITSQAFYNEFGVYPMPGNFFDLVEITGDTDSDPGPPNTSWSNIITGLFSDPSEGLAPTTQYYFVVNTRCNKEQGDTIFVNADPDTITLGFDWDPNDFDLETVWYDHNENSSITDCTLVGDDLSIEMILQPGDAILFSLAPPTTDTENSIRYTENTTLTGPRHYFGIVEIDSGATVTLDGMFIFDNDLKVEEYSTLIISDGSHIKFSGAECDLFVASGSNLDINGDEGNEVTLSSDDLADNDRDSWNGILINNFGSNIDIDYAIIRNAEVGIKIYTAQSNDTEVTVDDVTFEHCERAILSSSTQKMKITGGIVRNCENGFAAVSSHATGNYFKVYGVTFEDLDDYGFEANTMERAVAYECTFQNIGISAIRANNVDLLRLYGGPEEWNNVVRYCGKDADYWEGAVDVENSHLNIFYCNNITENSKAGLRSYLNTYATGYYNSRNLIASNALGVDFVGGTPGGTYDKYKSQVFIYDGFTFNTDDRKYDIFYKWPQAGEPDTTQSTSDDFYLISYLSQSAGLPLPEFACDSTYWGTIDSYSELVNFINTGLGFTLTQDSIQFLDENVAHADSGHYWGTEYTYGTFDSDPQQAAFEYAYMLIDSLHNYEQAEQTFMTLASAGFAPALKGLSTALLLQGENPASIELILAGIDPLNANDSFYRSRDCLIASVYQRAGDFETAIDRYQALADSASDPVDSLYALCQLEETVRLQALIDLYAVEDEDGPEIYSTGGESHERKIALADERIDDLNRQAANFLYRDELFRAGLLPTEFELKPAYPNPFNPSVTIPFALPKRAEVKVSIYNVLGQKVKTLLNRPIQAGHHQVFWHGKSNTGVPVSSGIYFVQMEAAGFVKTQKVVMLK